MEVRVGRKDGMALLGFRRLVSQATNWLMDGAPSAVRDIPSVVIDTALGLRPRAVRGINNNFGYIPYRLGGHPLTYTYYACINSCLSTILLIYTCTITYIIT